MRRLLALLAALSALAAVSPSPAAAQATSAVVVSACGTPPTTYSAGQNRQVTQDTNGRVCGSATSGPTPSSGSGIAPVVSGSAESSHVLKASPGNLYGVAVTSGAVAGYLLVFDATSAPVDGAVTPKACVVVPANSTVGLSYGDIPSVYATGITAVFSSTGCFTKTASATAYFAGRTQ